MASRLLRSFAIFAAVTGVRKRRSSAAESSVARARNLTSAAECRSWCEADYNGGNNQGRHCPPGDMANLCGGCSFCGGACESWCEADYNGGNNQGRHCPPGDMAHLCGGCSFCSGAPSPSPSPSPPGECNSCLCVFDIDRTLTGKQGDTWNCPRNRKVGHYDAGYGGGEATLSALANQGINSTFCKDCYLGIISAGSGSGESSSWNAYILNNIMRSGPQDRHPEFKSWSYGTNVRSPFVLNQGNRVKQESAELIRRWYGDRGICVEPSNFFFYGDRTENIAPFRNYGLNSREISCGSRDPDLYGGSGIVGYCGATPEEVVNTRGNILCR